VDEADAMTTMPARTLGRPGADPGPGDDSFDWVALLAAPGPGHEDAVRRLHGLMVRAARRHVGRSPTSAHLGRRTLEDVVQTAADEATVAVLSRLDSFEGRSRFTTWAFKFGILHAAVELRRAAWHGREVDLSVVAEPVTPAAGPELVAEAVAFTGAVGRAMESCLTDHQRRVALALLVDGVPIDVLAERLGSNRNAVYKTLHDVRVRLRAELCRTGYLPTAEPTDDLEGVAP
jgi:RNA polymerase sigma-70 factor (ECF subfamily)